MAGGCALQTSPHLDHCNCATKLELLGSLRRRGKRVHEADGHGVLVIHWQESGAWKAAGPVRENVLVRHVAAVLQSADDVAGQRTLQRPGKLAHFLLRSRREAVVVYEIL